MTTGHDVVRRLWRARADTERRLRGDGSAQPALDALGRPDRSMSNAWLDATSAEFDRYRSMCAPVADRIGVVCASRRPRLLADVVANVSRQTEVDVEFVLVTNDDGFGAIDVAAGLAALPSATIVEMPPDATLGACLNAGLDATGERFVAKFDDDDWYGHHHLADSLRAHGYSGAGVVGKHTYYADVGESAACYLRFAGHEFTYSGSLAGGTLVIDRGRTGDQRFADVSIGEDRHFLAACHRRGVSTFSADRFGFVQRRFYDNTWAVTVEEFLIGCVAVDRNDVRHAVDR